MAWCEDNGVDTCSGWHATTAWSPRSRRQLAAAEREAAHRRRPARRYRDFQWRTLKSWSRKRRVIGKAEWTKGEANPRFIVTSLDATQGTAAFLYEDIYCARGDMENRIKECQLDLYADRTPATTMRANQLRLWFASFAYVLMCALRRIALAGTELAKATCGSIRLKLLKIGAQVTSERAPRQVRAGLGVSGSLCLGLRCHSSRHRQRSRLARLTRAAATRNLRGITRGPPRPHSRLSRPDIVQAPRVCRRHGGPRLQKTNKPPANLPNHAKMV